MTTADVTPIEEFSAGRILSTGTIIIGNLLTMVPLALMMTGIGIAGVAAMLTFAEQDVSDRWRHALPPTVGVPLIVFGVVMAALSAYWGLRNVTKLGNWYLRGLARRIIISRGDAIVDPDDAQ